MEPRPGCEGEAMSGDVMSPGRATGRVRGGRFAGRPAARLAVAMLALVALAAVEIGGAAAQEPGALPREPGPRLRWTDKPVRVDREAQDLERLPDDLREDPYPMILEFPPRSLRVENSATFTLDGRPYRVANVEPRERREICADPLGRRLACGARGRAGLRSLLIGRRLACRIESERAAATIVECGLGGESLSQRLLRESWAKAPAVSQ